MDKISSQPKNQPLSPARRRHDVLGVQVDDVTLPEAIELILGWVKAHRTSAEATAHLVVTANPEYVMAALHEQAFMALVNSADLVTPDGIGLIGAGKLLGKPFRSRVTGVALAQELFRLSAADSLSIGEGPRLFLLGAAPGVAEEAAEKIRQAYPGARICGTFAGKAGPEGDEEALAHIREAGAEIVLVAYGMLKQDWWAARNIQRSGAAVAIGVGGVLDYTAGRVPLAPAWLRRWGLEWAYRLYKEPWRWRRQLALPQFVALVCWARVRHLVKK
ncbi:MAG TPA: WecB/TagA/CpsF family glycosyltransferase [Chloroflexia bacterium]|nr:WecB/TagA/CpsF family glycosyltransferase [Chloroflexia bacterium]